MSNLDKMATAYRAMMTALDAEKAVHETAGEGVDRAKAVAA